MSDETNIVRAVRARQSAIRREMDRRGMSLKAIAFDSKVPYQTVLSYFPEEGGKEPATMPASALFAFCGVIPDELLSLLLPEGRQIVQLPEDLDHDALCELAADYVHTKAASHRVDSEAGVQIGPNEHTLLTSKIVTLRAA